MDSKTLFKLLDAICLKDTSLIQQICENKQFTGTFTPNPLSLALRTNPLQTEIVQMLLQHGFRPIKEDLDYYHLSPSLQTPQLTELLTHTPTSSHRSWFRNTSLSSSQFATLLKTAFDSGNATLSQHLFSKRALLSIPEKRNLLFFAAEKGHPLIAETFLTEQQPPQHKGIWAHLTHRFSSLMTYLRYGDSTPYIKDALLTAVQQKQTAIVQTLFKKTEFEFSLGENNQLLNAFLTEPFIKYHAPQAYNRLSYDTLLKVLMQEKRIKFPEGWFDETACKAIWNGQVKVMEALRKHSKLTLSTNELVSEAARVGSVEIVTLLIQDPQFNPKKDDSEALRLAAENGHSAIVEALLKHPHINPAAKHNEAIRTASARGHLDVVKTLLADSRVNPAAHSQFSIAIAAKNGHLKVVEALLQDSRIDPSDNNHEILCVAAEKGHQAIVKLLLKDTRVNPSAEDNLPIHYAIENGHFKVVTILLKNKNIRLTPEEAHKIGEIAIQKGNLDLLKALLESRSIKLHLSDPLFKSAAKKEPIFTKLLLAFVPEAPLSNPSQKEKEHLVITPKTSNNEITYLRSLLTTMNNPEINQHLKTLKAHSLIHLKASHLIEHADILYSSKNQEEFTTALTNIVKDKATITLRDCLEKTLPEFNLLIRLKQTSESSIGTKISSPSTDVTLSAPLLPKPLAVEFFKLANDASSHYLKEKTFTHPVIALVNQVVNTAVKTLAPMLYSSKIAADSWVNKTQAQNTKAGISTPPSHSM